MNGGLAKEKAPDEFGRGLFLQSGNISLTTSEATIMLNYGKLNVNASGCCLNHRYSGRAYYV